jgi:ATP-dependent Clp protease adaptor protein ClpS
MTKFPENISAEEKTSSLQQEKTEAETELPFKVLLYNDDWHTFDEVIIQLIKALRCSIGKAKRYAFEAHVKGSAVIFTGELSKCLRITSVLEEIALHTEIVSE